MTPANSLRRALVALACLAGASVPLLPAPAAAADAPVTSRDNFMVVVRESVGSNKQDEALVPLGPSTATLADGRRVEIRAAWWDYIGDVHVRFVFDQPDTMIDATPEDLERLKVADVHEALALAMANVRRVYGEPQASPFAGGVMSVSGRSPDLESSYFLDRQFWRARLREHPEGLVVAVPQRGGLLYVPLGDRVSVEALRKNVGRMHESGGAQRVSSALFLFKDDHWSVFQAPVAR